MSISISIENLSKKYILGSNVNFKNNTLRDDISKKILSVFNKANIVDDTNSQKVRADKEFWALKDINLEINTGDRIGIIGRNGAGKSTLLKLLSRITEPSSGIIKLKGRVASLLEVGTGFHPELTGRENIFLNGSLLGMNKQEIIRNFDEIVSFAEVEKFLDTPVKRYSSGMYVRLAFAVAAHLEPEILIVDEVLAVGDAQFQKKCLGKMEDVGKEGRTVLFVSHNMSVISSLCTKAVLLEAGQMKVIGNTSDVIMQYYQSNNNSPSQADYSDAFIGDDNIRLLSASIKSLKQENKTEIKIDESVIVEMNVEVIIDSHLEFVPNIYFYNSEGVCAFISVADNKINHSPGLYKTQCILPENFLNDGTYFVGLSISSFNSGVKVHFFEQNALTFNVTDSMDNSTTRSDWAGAMPGVVRPKLSWEIKKYNPINDK